MRHVVFALILGLALVSGFAAEAAELPSDLPQAQTACDADPGKITVSPELPAAAAPELVQVAPGEKIELAPPYPNKCLFITCDQWDSQYCDYRCIGYDCCQATILIPNSYCPLICA